MKWGRLGLAMITLVQFQTVQVYGETTHQKVESIDSSLFPIETQPVTGTPIDDLFPTQPHITPGDGSNGNGTGKTQTGNQQKPTNGNTTTGGTTTNGNGSMKTADTTFKCSLFENTDFKDVLSAVNSLNQAVGSPSCGGTSINVQGIQDNNKKIADAVKALNGFLENPETVQPENAAAIVNNVDIAVRAANALATTFGSSDLMNKNCRDQMNGGQVALALNDIINGLTPYALMAATMTGGTAAVPFIVGGSVITGALSSMNKIVTENSTKINDAQVRRAIVENTCQFIRLDQKYKFLIKNRDEQVSKISKEITASQNLFSQKVDGLSKKTSGLVNRRNALSDTSSSLDKKLSAAVNQLAMDKAFVVGTTDEIKICQIGLQLASLSQDQSSYVATMLNSVDEAMLAYGSSNIAEARALKFSGQIALNSLNQMASQQFTMNSDFSGCAKAAKSFVETVEQSGALAKRIVKVAQDNVDKELKSAPDYGQFQSHMLALAQKQHQADRVEGSLDNLRKYANSFTQSEIDAEMARLRQGLFGQRTLGINSPVMAWFNYTKGLHNGAVSNFKAGLDSLRQRAYRLSTATIVPGKLTVGQAQDNTKEKLDKAWDDAYQLRTFDAAFVKKGSVDYVNSCREMQDVWNVWTAAVDHLAAIESFCSMIEPYIYDNRAEDRTLVDMCRGVPTSPNYTVSNDGGASTLQQLKNSLIKDYSSEWALRLKKRVDAMACPQPSL